MCVLLAMVSRGRPLFGVQAAVLARHGLTSHDARVVEL